MQRELRENLPELTQEQWAAFVIVTTWWIGWLPFTRDLEARYAWWRAGRIILAIDRFKERLEGMR